MGSLHQWGGNVKPPLEKKRKRKGGRVRTCPLGDIPKDLEVTHYFLFLYPDYHAHASQPVNFGFLLTDVI